VDSIPTNHFLAPATVAHAPTRAAPEIMPASGSITSRRTALATLAASLAACTRNQHEPTVAAAAAPIKPAPVNRLIFGGDVMLSRHVGLNARQRHDPAAPFRELAPYLAAADIAFVNLEGPFSQTRGHFNRGMVFKASPDMVEGLVLAGIDIVSTANNHARDCGREGVAFTIHWLKRHGIATAGTGLSDEQAHLGAVLERHGVRFGFLAYTYDQANGNYPDTDDRIAMFDVPRMQADVRSMLASRADVTIVSMHGGAEYWKRPHPLQTRFARAAVDAGATLVIGHHPHVVQPIEQRGSAFICYSLGNLVFDQSQRKETQRGLLFEAVFTGRRLDAVRAQPVEIRDTVPRLLT
jgi:poly-gamma-glutamate capsule biosynthesis protein CapA/YwtB (metallophosphatase superfamily)